MSNTPTTENNPKSQYRNPRTAKALWVGTTNFAEGLPYTVVRILSTIYFTDIGLKERYLGYLNFLGTPWNLKFLWAPFLDLVSTKRRWLIGIQVLMSAVLLIIAGACYLAYVPKPGLPVDPSSQLLFGSQYLSFLLIFISVSFVALAFVAATNDIAIDAYYLAGLPDPRDQAAYSGYRVMAYRLAMIFGRSGLVALVAYMAYYLEQHGNINLSRPWAYGFAAAGITMLVIAIFHAIELPYFEGKRADTNYSVKQITKSFGRSFASYLDQEKIATVLIFIILYKIGDEILFSMNTVFLKRELHITNAQIAWLAGIVGAFGAVLGSMMGGLWIKKQGLKKAIWPLTLLMNLNIWAYVWLAYAKPDPTTSKGIILIACLYWYEQVAAGLGATALTIFMMRTCKPEFKAGHYAIGSAIMTIPSTLIGGFSGQIVERVGYVNFFILAFLISIPSMLLLFIVPIKDEPPALNTST